MRNGKPIFVVSVFFLCLVMLSTVVSRIMSADTSAFHLYSIDPKGIHRSDADGQSQKTILNTSEMYGVSFSVAPSDTLIAILITERGVVPPGTGSYSVLPRNWLLLIDRNGKEITRLDDNVRKFSWSPDGERIAYITGTYYEGGVGFMTTGVWIFDLRDESKIRIEKDFPHEAIDGFIGGGFEINWAQHDTNIYIEDFDYLDGIYRYNIIAGKSEKVGHQGITFSPDGQFYLASLTECSSGIRVFRTATHEEITDQIDARFGGGVSDQSMNWVFDQGHLAHYFKEEYKFASENDRQLGRASSSKIAYNVLYDVEKDEIVKELTQPISRWTAGPGRLVFEDNGRFVVETYERLSGD